MSAQPAFRSLGPDPAEILDDMAQLRATIAKARRLVAAEARFDHTGVDVVVVRRKYARRAPGPGQMPLMNVVHAVGCHS